MDRIIPLARSRHGRAKDQETDAATWEREMAAFPESVRSTATHMAAHSWDVTLVDDVLLVTCAWYSAGGCYAFTKDGTDIGVPPEQHDRLYPVVPGANRWTPGATYNDTDRAYRSKTIALGPEAAACPASGIEAATAGETRSGSTEGESPAPEGGDAQCP